ncbi:hypothetical protein BIY22_16325 [Vibrio panuliri]|uniref:Uncharacterized protein n=1 Tax=Vibrio panuliri TaxID=1381081 RepID=A0A1Q9HMZ5_9VIBR|nr:hypothetical protein BIY22_16325 [Vibrio panuliri]
MFNGSSFNSVQHEPFNIDRIFKHVIEQWKENQNIQILYENIECILKEKPLIKHCLEIMPKELNQVLMEVSAKYGYKHLFLYREKAKSRLLSLNYSMKTNVWGKEHLVTRPFSKAVFDEVIPIEKLIDHEINARNEMQWCYEYLSKDNQRPLAVSFEQLYKSDFAYSSILVKQLFVELIGNDDLVTYEFLDKTLKRGSQGTNDDYTRFPNSNEFINNLDSLPDFKLYRQAVVDYTISDDVKAIYHTVWPCLPGICFEQFFVQGVLLSEHGFDIESSQNIGELVRGLDSQRVHKMYPEQRGSKQCRFIYGPILSREDIRIIKCT